MRARTLPVSVMGVSCWRGLASLSDSWLSERHESDRREELRGKTHTRAQRFCVGGILFIWSKRPAARPWMSMQGPVCSSTTTITRCCRAAEQERALWPRGAARRRAGRNTASRASCTSSSTSGPASNWREHSGSWRELSCRSESVFYTHYKLHEHIQCSVHHSRLLKH